MPLPKPKLNEKSFEFVRRCMEDETVKKEFTREGQRLARCIFRWRKSKQ